MESLEDVIVNGSASCDNLKRKRNNDVEETLTKSPKPKVSCHTDGAMHSLLQNLPKPTKFKRIIPVSRS